MSHLLLDRSRRVLSAMKDGQTLTASTWQKLTWDSPIGPDGIAWGTPTAVTNDLSCLSQPGSVVTAANVGGSTVTIGGINFTNTSISGWILYSGLSITHPDTNFKNLLNSINFTNTQESWFQITGLTAGKVYSVQIFHADNRAGYGTRTQKYCSGSEPIYSSGHTLASGTNGYGTYIIGTFTAQSSNHWIKILNNNFYQAYAGLVSAYIVRELSTSSVPYFTTSSSTFTCTVPGRYYVQVQLGNQTANRGVYNRIHKNGSAIRDNPLGNWWIGSYGFIQCDVFPVDLAAGDTLEAYAYSTNGGSVLHTTTSSAPADGIRIFYGGGVGTNTARPTHQKLMVAKTSGQSISTDTIVKMTLDAASVNTANFTDSSDTFTATIPGVYAVFWQLYTTGGEKGAFVYKNSALYAKSGPSNYNNQCFCLVELAVGDTLEFYGYFSSTTGLDVAKSVAEVVLL